jgi:hypothetical protein
MKDILKHIDWRWKAVLLAAAAIVVTLAARCTMTSISESTVSIAVDEDINITPEQIESIKAIGEWEFLSVADEELVDTTRRGIFTNDHLVRIYYGTVRLGINMHQVKPGWIQTQGDSISVTLPKVGLLSRDFIDEARTKTFHESGRWKPADREALYWKAHRQMLKHCLTQENLRNAGINGEAQFRRMMKALGFDHVSISFEQ